MKRQITGLNAADRCAADQVPDGIFLARVQRVSYRRQTQKPYYSVSMVVLEPHRFCGACDLEPSVLQSESALETQLVLA